MPPRSWGKLSFDAVLALALGEHHEIARPFDGDLDELLGRIQVSGSLELCDDREFLQIQLIPLPGGGCELARPDGKQVLHVRDSPAELAGDAPRGEVERRELNHSLVLIAECQALAQRVFVDLADNALDRRLTLWLPPA